MARLLAAFALGAALIIVQPATHAGASPAPPEPPPSHARVEPPARPDDSPSDGGPPERRSTILEDVRAPSSIDRSLETGLQAAAPSGNRTVGTILAAGGDAVVNPTALASLASVTDRTPARDGGPDRYATSVQLSASQYPEGADEAWLATGENFPDGLTASAIAGAHDGPVLLTTSRGLPGSVRDELARLSPTRVWIVGGTGVIPDGVVAGVRAAVPGAQVARVAGADRYATAAAIADTFAPSSRSVFVATGLGFPDALSTGPAAAGIEAPTLLVSTTAVPASTEAELRRLHPATVFVVGGPAVVADSTMSRVRSITGANVVRVAGADRFATAAAVADRFFAPTTPSVVAANAFSFPDSIAAGAVAGARHSPLLLVDQQALPPRATVDAARRVSWWLPESGRVIRYSLITHPDDEFSAWSVLGERDPRRYDVLVVLTTGETTEYCTGRPVEHPWTSQQFLPQPQPTGLPYSERCRDHRMQSWRTFMERAGVTGVPDPVELTGGPVEFGGRVIPVPLGRDTTGAVVEAPTYDLAVGPDHAVAAFDLSALLPDEVLWALQTVRGQSARFPTQVEGDVIGAGYFNDVASGFVDTHPDHLAVRTLLGTVDLGLPGSQYAPVGHAHPTRSFGASVADYCGMMCHPAAAAPFRGSMGTFQYAYGWLADGFWEPGDVDQRTGFSRYQSFSKWF